MWRANHDDFQNKSSAARDAAVGFFFQFTNLGFQLNVTLVINGDYVLTRVINSPETKTEPIRLQVTHLLLLECL